MLYNEQTPEEYEDMVGFFETGSTGNKEAAPQGVASSVPSQPVEEDQSFLNQLGSGVKHQFKERATAIHKTLGAMSSDPNISRYAERQARAAFEEGKQLEREMGTVGQIASAATGIGMDLGTAFIPGGAAVRAASAVASNTLGTTSEIINQQMRQQEVDPSAEVDVGSAWKHGLGSGVINAGLGYIVPGGKLPTRLASGGAIGSGGAMVDQAAVNLATGNDLADNMLMAGTIGGVLGVGGAAALDRSYNGPNKQEATELNNGGKNAIKKISLWSSKKDNISEDAVNDYIASANINQRYHDLYNDPDLDPERARNLASKQILDNMETGTMSAALDAAQAVEEALGGVHRGIYNLELQAADGSSLGRLGDSVNVSFKDSSVGTDKKTGAKPSLFRTVDAQKNAETNASFEHAAQTKGKDLAGRFEKTWDDVKSVIRSAKLEARAKGLDTNELSEMESAVQRLAQQGADWAGGNNIASTAVKNDAEFLMQGLVNNRLINSPDLKSTLDPKAPFNPIQELTTWRSTEQMLSLAAPNWRMGVSDKSKETGTTGKRLPVPSVGGAMAQEAAFRFGMPFVDVLKQKAFRKEKAKTKSLLQEQRDLLDSKVLAQRPIPPKASEAAQVSLARGDMAGSADNSIKALEERNVQVDSQPITSVVTGEPVSVSAADAPITTPAPAARSGNLSGSVARPKSPADIQAAKDKANEAQQQANLAKQQAEDLQARANEVRTMARNMGKSEDDPQVLDVQKQADEANANALQAQQEANILRSNARLVAKQQNAIPSSPQAQAETQRQATNFAEEARKQRLAEEQAALAAQNSASTSALSNQPATVVNTPDPVVQDPVVEPEVVVPGSDSKGMQVQPKPEPKASEKAPEPVEEEVDTTPQLEADKPAEDVPEPVRVQSSELAKKVSSLKEEVSKGESNLRLSTKEHQNIQVKKKEIADLEDKMSTLRKAANQKKVDESIVVQAYDSLPQHQKDMKGSEFSSHLNKAIDNLKDSLLTKGGKKGEELATKVEKAVAKDVEMIRAEREAYEENAIREKHKSFDTFAKEEKYKGNVKEFLRGRGILDGEDFDIRSARIALLKENAPVPTPVSKKTPLVHTPESAKEILSELNPFSEKGNDISSLIDDKIDAYKASGKEITPNDLFKMYNEVKKAVQDRLKTDLDNFNEELAKANEEMDSLQAALSSTKTDDVVNEATFKQLTSMMKKARAEADSKSNQVTATQKYLDEVNKANTEAMESAAAQAKAEADELEAYNKKVALEEANKATIEEQENNIRATLEELQIDEDFIEKFFIGNTRNSYKPLNEQALVTKANTQWNKLQQEQSRKSKKISNEVLKDVNKMSETEVEGALNEVVKKLGTMESSISNLETISGIIDGILDKAGKPTSESAQQAVKAAEAFNNALSRGIEMKKKFPRSPHLWISRGDYNLIQKAYDKVGKLETSHAGPMLKNLRSLIYSNVSSTEAGKKLISEGPMLSQAQIDEQAKKLLSRRAKRTIDPDVVVR